MNWCPSDLENTPQSSVDHNGGLRAFIGVKVNRRSFRESDCLLVQNGSLIWELGANSDGSTA